MVIMGLPCTATLLHMAFPLSAPLGAFSSGPSVRIKASSPWELQRWYGNRLWELLWLLTAGADYLCLPKCPNSYLQRVWGFFYASSCEKRYTIESCISLHKYWRFWFFHLGAIMVWMQNFYCVTLLPACFLYWEVVRRQQSLMLCLRLFLRFSLVSREMQFRWKRKISTCLFFSGGGWGNWLLWQ